MHRLTDGQNGDPAAERAIKDLMANCCTKVLYKQRSDAIAETAAVLRTTDMVMQEVRALKQGRAVWLVEDQAHVVDHLLMPDTAGFSEHAVIDTDQALLDEYRTLDGDGWNQWTDTTT